MIILNSSRSWFPKMTMMFHIGNSIAMKVQGIGNRHKKNSGIKEPHENLNWFLKSQNDSSHEFCSRQHLKLLGKRRKWLLKFQNGHFPIIHWIKLVERNENWVLIVITSDRIITFGDKKSWWAETPLKEKNHQSKTKLSNQPDREPMPSP